MKQIYTIYTPTKDKIRELEERCANKDCGSVTPRLICKNCNINIEYKRVVGVGLNEWL